MLTTTAVSRLEITYSQSDQKPKTVHAALHTCPSLGRQALEGADGGPHNPSSIP